MSKKIKLAELDCYKNADEATKNHPLIKPNRAFDLEKLNSEELASEMERFVRYRGTQVTCLSLRTEFYLFNQTCEFVNEMFPELKSFVGTEIEIITKKMKLWLMKNGKSVAHKRYRAASGKDSFVKNDVLSYVLKIWNYFNKQEENTFNYDSDVWVLNGLEFDIRGDPTRGYRSISFSCIPQVLLKSEIKQVLYVHLRQKAIGTVFAEVTAIKRFSKFLANEFPEIDSLQDVDREVMERYLVHTNTEATGRKNYSKELSHLKTVFKTASRILEKRELVSLFQPEDISFTPNTLYKYYSDDEIKRFNEAVVAKDEQIARLMYVHQLLGTRISETLTLKQDCIFKDDDGRLMIRIYQIKSRRYYEKTINEDIKALLEKAMEYTNSRYGKREYVFVSDADPDKPMQYGRLQYQLMVMVQENNLCDDSGRLLGVGTHIFRHNYGKRLTDLHESDETIARLLGHANTSSVHNYRKISSNIMTSETKHTRNQMDDKLREIMKGW